MYSYSCGGEQEPHPTDREHSEVSFPKLITAFPHSRTLEASLCPAAQHGQH